MTSRNVLIKSRFVKAGGFATVFLGLSASVAAAACSQDQLTGNWALSGSDNAKWVRCEFTVGPSATYRGTCTGTRRPASGDRIVGRLRVDEACKLTGTHRSGDQPRAQPLLGDLQEDGTSGSGILKFGTRRQNFGNLFTLERKP